MGIGSNTTAACNDGFATRGADTERGLPERIENAGQRACPEKTGSCGSVARHGVIRLSSFILVLVVAAFGLDAAICHGLRSIKTSKFGSLNRIFDGQVNVDIVINGSSRALSHYDPRTIQRSTGCTAYNIGMNASQIDFEYALLKTYLKRNTKPKLVIQNLDLFSFETTKPGAIYDPGYYVPYLHEDEIYNFLHRVDPDVWRSKYIPLYGYSVEDMRFTWVLGLMGCFGYHGPEDYYLGFNPSFRTWSEDFERFRIANAQGVTYPVMPEGVLALEEIIKTCHLNGIQVVLVYSPEYVEVQQMEKNRAEIIDDFQKLSGRLHAPFWDYSNSPICRRRELFYNSEHLNWQGAAIFSEDLADRLANERPWEQGGLH